MSRIIVKNLPTNITEEKLRSIFGIKGQVTDVQLKFTKQGVFRGFAFIGYHDEASVEEAVKYFDKSSINTKQISVENCAALGDEQKPKSWSKYAKDSSAFKNALKEKENGANKTSKKEKPKKVDATKELLCKYKDDPLFDEFLQVHSSKKAQELLRELKTPPVSKTPDKNEENPTQLTSNNISDEDYLNLLKKTTPRKKMEKKPKVKLDLYHLKLANLPYTFKKKDLKEFFRPLVPYSIRIPRHIKGIAFVGFKEEKKFNKALLKDKSIIKGKQITLTQVRQSVISGDNNEQQITNKKWTSQAEALKNEESVAESGRLFLRNLSYTTTEEDLRREFEKYGPLAELNLPVDSQTRKMKGFGFVTFVMPEHAVKAYAELDGNILHGRMLHLLPGKHQQGDNDEEMLENSSNFKKKQAMKQKSQANSAHNWNTLFLGQNAVADVIASTYDTTKEKVLEGSGAAVRLALGETQIVATTRKYLEEHGIVLDAFSNPNSKRSKTVILVKNLPANTKGKEITSMFEPYGVIGRFIFPPSGITAIIEFIEPSEARKAFLTLAYKNFKGVPLYLEWAPENLTDDSKKLTNISEKQVKDDEKPADVDSGNEEEEPEENTTLHVKNLDFSVTDQVLRDHFIGCGQIHYANIATKKDPDNPSKTRSMGYGFVRFMRKTNADNALKTLQFSSLAGKTIELKRSERILPNDLKPKRKTSTRSKQNGTKILVKNIPFQAKYKEILQLFKTFGELKAVRLPKKMGNSIDSHRGFGFVDYSTNSDAKNAFEALSQSTHLYGRRLILEWAQNVEDVDDIRKRTADHFHQPEFVKKSKKGVIDMENMQ